MATAAPGALSTAWQGWLVFAATETGAPAVLTEVRRWQYQGSLSLRHRPETVCAVPTQRQKPCTPGRPQPSAFQQGELMVSPADVYKYVLLFAWKPSSLSWEGSVRLCGRSTEQRPRCRAGT